jgi:hypothetical protein
MPALLHECWEGDNGGEFCVVREHSDRLRPMLMPNARLVFSLRASSWFEAMWLHNQRLDYGDYIPPDGIDLVYTDEEAAEQESYLRVRDLG